MYFRTEKFRTETAVFCTFLLALFLRKIFGISQSIKTKFPFLSFGLLLLFPGIIDVRRWLFWLYANIFRKAAQWMITSGTRKEPWQKSWIFGRVWSDQTRANDDTALLETEWRLAYIVKFLLGSILEIYFLQPAPLLNMVISCFCRYMSVNSEWNNDRDNRNRRKSCGLRRWM